MAKENKHELYGQYAWDKANGRISKDKDGTLDMRGDGDAGFHQEGVYGTAEADPNEGSYGEGIQVRRGLGRSAARLGNDEAEAWLAANDRDYEKSRKDWQ